LFGPTDFRDGLDASLRGGLPSALGERALQDQRQPFTTKNELNPAIKPPMLEKALSNITNINVALKYIQTLLSYFGRSPLQWF
jgi:hypothetical protein